MNRIIMVANVFNQWRINQNGVLSITEFKYNGEMAELTAYRVFFENGLTVDVFRPDIIERFNKEGEVK